MRYNQESYIDVTLSMEDVVGNVKNWRVSGEETLGWHRIIEYEYMERVKEVVSKVNGGWTINEVILDLFQK